MFDQLASFIMFFVTVIFNLANENDVEAFGRLPLHTVFWNEQVGAFGQHNDIMKPSLLEKCRYHYFVYLLENGV